MENKKVGIIGCGDISEKYLDTLLNVFKIEVVAVADIVFERALVRSKQFGIPHACKSNDELLAIPEIDIVVVLVNPPYHYGICKLALMANKNVYVEKPLSLTCEEGAELLSLANAKGLQISSAPDTILAAGIQTARKAIDDGLIGTPFAASSHIINGGHEFWHPNPGFFYKEGAGPLFDVAPYYITALAYLLGPIKSVQCSSKTTFAERTITSKPLFGQKIKVEVPTHLAGILNHQNGVISTILHSFDVSATKLSWEMEIYGTEGTLVVPSPCLFGGNVQYKRSHWGEVRKSPDPELLAKYGIVLDGEHKESGMMEIIDDMLRNEGWTSLSYPYCYDQDYRGLGVADLADALSKGRKPRLNADFCYHVLEVMTGLLNSQEENKAYFTHSSFERTEPIDVDTKFGEI